MNKINDTMSLCEHCYRHIPAVKFKKDNKIFLGKQCPEHGYTEHLIEPNAEFYLNYNYPKFDYQTYFIDITNKCNLNCPHCYQIPDNNSKDLPISYFTNLVSSWQDDGYNICLAGAEPTTRNDLDILIRSLKALPGKERKIIILTNGIKLSDWDYAKKFEGIDGLCFTIGLNHPDYQGKKVREKQIAGLNNCVRLKLDIKNISYTLENFDQLEYCLVEIQEYSKKYTDKFRIRVGSDIGRVPSDQSFYLSDLVNCAREISKKHNWEFNDDYHSSIRAHYATFVNSVYIKFIQWPSVKTIDLEEKQTETWASLIPNYPITPLIHQAIIRDAVINKKLNLHDAVPEKYTRPLEGKKQWKLAKSQD